MIERTDRIREQLGTLTEAANSKDIDLESLKNKINSVVLAITEELS
jgi:hypothetical protein